jgi:alkylation response protein AidB-like acyl-CoA dehydrogenase
MHPYQLNEGEQGVVFAAAAIAQEIGSVHAADVDANARFPKEAVDALAGRGFLGLCVARELGGQGHGPRAFAAAVEELAQGCASTAMVYVMHVSAAQAIAASTLLQNRDELLREIANGKHLTTLALSERGSRSHFWAPVSKLAPAGDSTFTTTAYKSWVTAADYADSYVSSAQRPGAASALDSTVYLARKGVGGLRVAGAFDGLGLRGNDSAPVVLEDLRLTRGDLISELGQGPQTMLEVILPWFAIGTAAMANGLCRAAVTATSNHLQGAGFEHTGARLRDLPTLRARLAEMSVRTEQARALLGFTLAELLTGSPATPLYILQSRLASLGAAVEVTDLAMKACGGAAFSRHLAVERLFRDARAGWVMAPTVDQLQDFIGRVLTGLPLFDGASS